MPTASPGCRTSTRPRTVVGARCGGDTRLIAEPEETVDLYGASYGGFAETVYAEVRREAYGDEVGQASWLTRDELDRFGSQLGLGSSSRLLEIASGSGGPALHLVRSTGCEVVGIDFSEEGVANANRLASEAGLDARARFLQADATQPLELENGSFSAVLCVDAINHLAGRDQIFAEWLRVLQPGGRLLFTDPTTVTGLLGIDEIVTRASIGYFVFLPPGEDERLLNEAGFRVLAVEDATENMAEMAGRWREARASREEALRTIEGEESFEGEQRFLEVASTLARERRLSRAIYLAEKPD
jgi:ubiquinone/menaquinone biosynthesis C-methylase UbiE